MHVSLTPELEQQVKRKVDSGLYNNASEVVRESLRLMIERDAVRERLQAELHIGFEQLRTGQTVRINSEAEFEAVARANR
jgi:antitoxin ParD1/3/4